MIRVDNLVKKFGDLAAVDNISFDVDRGEIFAFLGPNGAGKTTTIKLSLGLIFPDGGSVRLFGEDVRRVEVAHRGRGEAPLTHQRVAQQVVAVGVGRVEQAEGRLQVEPAQQEGGADRENSCHGRTDPGHRRAPTQRQDTDAGHGQCEGALAAPRRCASRRTPGQRSWIHYRR